MSVLPANADTSAQRRGFLPPLKYLAQDIPASLVVFLIAIPLSLGIALASGAPIMAGIIAAACGGILAGIVAGAPLLVSGPAAGLTAIVFAYTQQLGWPVMCVVTICAGLLQIILGSSRVARICLAVSPAVVHGMLAGIGITIILSQLHIVLGGKPESHALINLRELPGQVIGMHTPSAFLGILTIGLLLLWQAKWLPARLKAIPGSLVAIVMVTLVSVIFALPVARIDLKGGLSSGFAFPHLPPSSQWGAVAVAAVTIAIVASVESLLSAVATEKLHTGPRADLDRELIGQGLANTVSGALGGLPITGVIVRSSANVRAGAKSQLSAILHGVWVLIAVAALTGIIQQIPLSALAGLLVFVGIQLVNVHHIRSVVTHREAAIYFVTVGGVVCLNLLEGVALGVGLAIFLLLKRLTSTRVTVEQSETHPNIRHVRIDGSLTFMSVPKLTRELSAIPAGTRVEVDLLVDFMDQAAFEALHGWRATHERMGGSVDIDEIHERWYHSAEQGQPRAEKGGLASVVAVLLGHRRGRTPAETEKSEPLLEGVRQYQKVGAPVVRPLLERLARDGQAPTELFIACSDSRVAPSLFTSSSPGNLFKLRNIGNLVPPCDCGHDGGTSILDEAGVASAVEYAVVALGVETLVVCGHSGCGAMKALLNSDGLSEKMPHVASWLRHGQPSLDRFNNSDRFDLEVPVADQLARVNVVQQLEHLRTYPLVREREQDGRLKLVGMFFDIESASVLIYDADKDAFVGVSEISQIAGTPALIGV